MNEYLTSKSRSKRIWDIPVLIVCGLMIVGDVIVLYDHKFQEGESIGVYIFIGLLFALPIAKILNRWLWRHRAQKLAMTFTGIVEESISLKALYGQAPMPNIERKLQHLISKQYLQNVRLDISAGQLVFTNGNRQIEENAFIMLECPNCGASNRVRKDRIGRCSFCEQPLIDTSI